MKRVYSICLVVLLLFLSGCETQPDFWGTERGEGLTVPDTLGESENILYTVIPGRPNIMVNQVGYRPESKKTAIFRGQLAADAVEFRIIDSRTQKAVFTGRTEGKGQDPDTGDYISYGQFTEVNTEGDYYVEADGIGRSCIFRIGKDIYGEVFRKTYHTLEAGAEANGIQENCYVLANLLTAYELYTQICTYELTQNREEIPQPLVFARVQVEKMAAGQDDVSGAIGGDATKSAAFAGVAGQLSRLYRAYDKNYAEQCRKTAEKAWKYAERGKAEKDELYYASAQLFRLTGNEQYHQAVKSYLNQKESIPKGIQDMEIYGDVTYLMTEKNVDVELCKFRMDKLMDEVEAIASQSHEDLYQTVGAAAEGNMDGMLREMVRLAVVDYVITNHEYATVMENHLHYLLGRNPQASSYLGGFGTYSQAGRKQDILKSPERSAELLFMMSAVMNHAMDGQQ
ncbi:MAG: hypothetical protein GX234_01860 [Clostridiales bacterium]|nr:hypothetical protein [Clostridiales bacterium]